MSKTLGQPVNTTSLFSTSIRFTAPESFSASGSSSTIWTEHTDVYSFSMVMLEILSGLQPYHHLPTEHTVLMHIVRGEKPIRTHLDHQVVTNRIWRFLTSLWSLKAEMRPEMSGVAASLLGLWVQGSSTILY
ncbi:hypothetical protein C8R43DRAFT_403135 [Mycena crocata]|nr:hypothetical protein C8R43DRAFT_403135 [Mycena crocata]